MTTIVESDASNAELLVGAVGAGAEVVPSIDALRHRLEDRPDEFVVVLGPSVHLAAAVNLSETLRVARPALSVILLRPRVDASVLADALHSGMREVVEARDLTGLSLAVRRGQSLYQALTADRGGQRQSARGQLVTVFSAKGGVGKTTVATNLAVALAELGQRVCIVDLDLAFGDVAITMQMFPTHTITDALAIVGDIGPEELRPLLTTYSDSVSALLAPSAPQSGDIMGRNLIGTILASLKGSFDFVVVDTPPALDDNVLQAFDESDVLLLLLTPEIPALKNLKITLEMLELLNYPRSKYRIVLNRAESKSGLSQSDIEKTLKTTVSSTIPSAPEVPASINRGEPIVGSLPRHPVSLALSAIARECVVTGTATGGSIDLTPTVTRERRRGLHRRSKSA